MFLVWQKNRGKMKKSIDSGGGSCYTINCSGGERDTKYGGIAQLGERLNGIQEVSGSIPLISTNPNSGTIEYRPCGGIAQLGAPANGGNPPRCRETTIQSKSPETLEIQWFPVIWGYSSAGRALEWHSRGQRFDPAYLHQHNIIRTLCRLVMGSDLLFL